MDVVLKQKTLINLCVCLNNSRIKALELSHCGPDDFQQDVSICLLQMNVNPYPSVIQQDMFVEWKVSSFGVTKG